MRQTNSSEKSKHYIETFSLLSKSYQEILPLLEKSELSLDSSLEFARKTWDLFEDAFGLLSKMYSVMTEYRNFVVFFDENGERLDAGFRDSLQSIIRNFQTWSNRIQFQLYNISQMEVERDIFISSCHEKLEKLKELIPDKVPVLIYPRQREHYDAITKAAAEYGVYLDQSKPGAGKTYMTCKACPQYMAVYSPAILVAKWNKVGNETGKTIVEAMSYEALTGNKRYPSKSRFLVRDADGSFSTTPEFDDFLRKGGWLVLDEYQKLRNGKSYTDACVALICALSRAVKAGISNSKVALLSGTQGDKTINTYSLIRLLPIIETPHLYDYDLVKKSYTFFDSWYQVKDWMFKVDFAKATEIYRQYNPITILFECMLNIVIPKIASRMPMPEIGEYYNGFFRIMKEDSEPLKEALIELDKSIRPADEGGKGGVRGYFGKTTTALVKVESKIVRSMVRDSIILLEQYTFCKVILILWYREPLAYAVNHLSKYGCVFLNGDTVAKKRNEYIDLFNQPDLSCRVMVIHPEVGGSGLDLDDKIGRTAEFPHGLPRFTLCSPNYNLITLLQALSRASRANTLSIPRAFIYYAEGTPQQRIMNKLYEKSIVLRLLNGAKEEEEADLPKDDSSLEEIERRSLERMYDITYPNEFAEYRQPESLWFNFTKFILE